MKKSNQKIKNKNLIYLVIIICLSYAFFIVCSHPSIGLIPESNFDLSPESRLPRWFTLPPGLDRKDVNVEIYYYVPPPLIRSNTKTILTGPPPNNEILDKKIGVHRWHPETIKKKYQNPNYVIAYIDGIGEVIEHREPGPIFHITDDPKVTAVLKKK